MTFSLLTMGSHQGCHFSFLARNFLNGNIPSEIGETKALLELNLMSNNIQGQIPSALGQLENLVSLDLSKCCIQVDLACKILKNTNGILMI